MAMTMMKKMTGLVHGTCVLLRYDIAMMICKAVANGTVNVISSDHALVCTITS
jgi:hypothetical protein